MAVYNQFPIIFKLNDDLYKGTVVPDNGSYQDGVPRKFTVHFPAFKLQIQCTDDGWDTTNGHFGNRPLMDAIGDLIARQYE